MFGSTTGGVAGIVDGDGAFRSYLSEVLRREFGFGRVVEAASFASALREFGGDTAGLRDMDLGIFDVTGLSAADIAEGLATLPVRGLETWIAVARTADRAALDAATWLGAKGVISDRMRLYEVIAGIEMVLGGWIHLPTVAATRRLGRGPTFLEAEARFSVRYGT